MSKLIIASVLTAVLALPAAAESLEVRGMAPTLNGLTVEKAVVVTFDAAEKAGNPAVLYDRINRAAVLLCTSNPGGKSLLLSDKVEKCRAVAVRQTTRQLGLADPATASR